MNVDPRATDSAGRPAESAVESADTVAGPRNPAGTRPVPAPTTADALPTTMPDHSPLAATTDGAPTAAIADDTPSAVTATSPRRKTSAWRRWRRRRPFWGGLLIVLGGLEILLSEQAPLRVIVHLGVQGLAGYLVPTIMVLCGLLLWFSPQQRLFYALLATLLSLASWITSNLGGFFVGLLLGLVGGSLAFAWTPQRATPRPRPPRQRDHGRHRQDPTVAPPAG